MNLAQTRVIDPILTKIARGYQQAGMVANKLFPRVPVVAYGGQILQFGKESFQLVNTARAPGTATKRIRFGYEGKPYAVVPQALEAVVPRESLHDAAQVPGINLATRSIAVVQNVMVLGHEHKSAMLATDPSNYSNDNKTKFTASNSWKTPDSDPLKDIANAKGAIRGATGMQPNRLVVSPAALSALKQHPKIIERIKYTRADSVSIEMLKTLLELHDIVEAPAVFADGDKFGDVWGNHAVLAFVSDSPSPSRELPSYGYTYVIEGHPLIEKPYWDESTKSWVYGVSDDCTPVIAGADAGFLFESVGA